LVLSETHVIDDRGKAKTAAPDSRATTAGTGIFQYSATITTLPTVRVEAAANRSLEISPPEGRKDPSSTKDESEARLGTSQSPNRRSHASSDRKQTDSPNQRRYAKPVGWRRINQLMPSQNMQRTYLYVTPEEYSAVKSHGAQWDNETKRWYIDAEQSPSDFVRWLPFADDAESPEDTEFNIISDQAFVAAATVPCQQCSTSIEVICIYCDSGTASDGPLTQFSVSHITAMSEELREQLRPWPHFQTTKGGLFVNSCPTCGVRNDDLYLHTEPGDAFFDIPSMPTESIKLTPLAGTIQLSGSEHFQVD